MTDSRARSTYGSGLVDWQEGYVALHAMDFIRLDGHLVPWGCWLAHTPMLSSAVRLLYCSAFFRHPN